jgi:ppGpp synthetase/RelA/SpoT-type nucleotidyltranferase
MRADFEDLKQTFESMHSTLESIAQQIEANLAEIFDGHLHIDKVSSRAKSVDSFMKKTLKVDKDGKLKYEVPLKEIQDMIGARVVVYYKNDVADVEAKIKEYYQTVERTTIIPDENSKFGYEGLHFVCLIPNVFRPSKSDILLPDFFEMQIKTLFQHAWSQSNHGLGYKPGASLSDEEQRKLAYLAAQAWGADKMLEELINGQTIK